MKDIFVDTNSAQQFINPINEEYKELLQWLKTEGILTYNQKLLVEIGRGNQNLLILIDFLIKNGRANHIASQALKQFEFTKAQHKNFNCNAEDRIHLKTVVLSCRKIAIAGDIALRNDINGLAKYDGIQPQAYEFPSESNYKN